MNMSIKLTELERHEAYLRLYGILTSLPIAKDKRDEYLRLERKLTAELIKNWRKSYSEALEEIFKRIPAEISDNALKIITEGLLKALGTEFGNSTNTRQGLQKFIRTTYEKSKSEFYARSHFTLADSRAVEVLTKHNCFWLGEHYGKHIDPKIAEITQQAIEDGLGRNELAKELEAELGNGDYHYWDVVASSALVRARSFGCISGMEEAGIAECEILAMQDERMCSICDNMHGRVFSVAKAREKINNALDIDDPEAFKAAMPWHTSPPVGVSNIDIENAGMSLPPYHGRCRCTVVVVSESIPEVHTIEEANSVALKRGLTKSADFTGLDVRAANELIGCVANARKEFPKLPVLDFMGAMSRNENFRIDKGGNGQCFRTDNGHIGIGLNDKIINPKNLEKHLEDMKFGVKMKIYADGCDTIKGTCYHEIGHWIALIVNANEDKHIKSLFKDNFNFMKQKLSAYAKKDEHEFIAEAWSEVHCNSKMRPLAKVVAARLIELSKGLR